MLDDGFLVDEGTLVTSCRRWVDVDDGLITDGRPRGIHPIWVNTKREFAVHIRASKAVYLASPLPCHAREF